MMSNPPGRELQAISRGFKRYPRSRLASGWTPGVALNHATGGGRDASGAFHRRALLQPMPMLSLLKLIRGLQQTSDEMHARALAFAKAIGKTPITVKNSPVSSSPRPGADDQRGDLRAAGGPGDSGDIDTGKPT